MLNVRGDPDAWQGGMPQDGAILQGVNSAQNTEAPITIKGATVYIAPRDGNVGIGTTNPQAKLDVNGSLPADTITGGQNNTEGNLHIDAHNSSVGTRVVFINWFQGTGGLAVGNGHKTFGPVFANAFTVNSSKEAKTDIASSPYGLSRILKLNSVKFRYKGDESKTLHIGLIAEEVDQGIPEMVSKMENEDKGTIGIDYGKLARVLIEAVKAQQEQIEELKNTSNRYW